MKGQDAKNIVINKIANAFGDNFIGEDNKKFYVWAEENGEKMQVCISLTVPKNPIDDTTIASTPIKTTGKLDFEDMTPVPQTVKPAEITEKEKQLAEDLLRRLGL